MTEDELFEDVKYWKCRYDAIKADLDDERSKVAGWLMDYGYATGHGDTIGDMLSELASQIKAKHGAGITVGMVTAALAAVGEHDVSLSSSRRVQVAKMIQAALDWRPASQETRS